jgi:ribosome-associated heat shock protein Hsp15
MPSRRAKSSADAADTASEVPEAQRLDRWLWFARVTKSRSLAAGLIADGKVRVNRARVTKPSQTIKIDDVVTIAVHRHVRVLRMRDPGVRRGPAQEAVLLYEDLTPPAEPTVAAADATAEEGATGPASIPQAEAPKRDAGSGRPTKRDRRSLDRLRGDGASD